MIHKIQAIIFRINKGDIEYLLLKRIQEKGGFWQPVTGRIEGKEKERDAVIREVKEETGIKNILRIIEGVYSFKLEENEIEEFVFGVEVSSKEKISLEKNIYPEHDEFKWCGFKEAFSLLKWPGNKDGLKKLNDKINKVLK